MQPTAGVADRAEEEATVDAGQGNGQYTQMRRYIVREYITNAVYKSKTVRRESLSDSRRREAVLHRE